MKRGLKATSEFPVLWHLLVPETSPMKRGLKVHTSRLPTVVYLPLMQWVPPRGMTFCA